MDFFIATKEVENLIEDFFSWINSFGICLKGIKRK
jgi:hypothetical protein